MNQSPDHPPPARRLAVVVSHPIQYYSPWFRALQAESGLKLRVFYLWDFGVKPTADPRFQTSFQWDVDLLSGYESEFVPNRSRAPGAESFRGFDNPELTARLARWRPEAILLFGYAWLSHLRLIAWARRKRIPLIFRGDSHWLGRPAPGPLRRFLLRQIFRRFAAVTYVGKANRDYFIQFGVRPSRLFFAPHSVNAAHFDPMPPAVREAAAQLRRELGITPDDRVVLFAGKFVAEKQPRELIEAFLNLADPRAVLLLVGDGPEKESLHAAAARSAAGRIRFLPFANQSEMPARYLAADIFALPSRSTHETWGLAVNEAMHMGLPCLVSDRVGCQQDLVTDGETGWVFHADDARELQEKLRVALAAGLAPMKRAVAGRISGYTYAQTTAGLLAAFRTATATRRPPAPLP